jgi:putrescine transport system ATP-binding protein
MTAGALLSIRNVSKRFGAVTALDDVSLDVGAGEFFALLGPSGCGKTTLMRLVAGFETLDTGGIWLAGKDLAAAPPHRRPVNMMFQSYALFPHLDVFGNIAFGLKRQNKSREEISARVGELLRIVQMTGLGSRRIDQLSGGQKQRVALARALAPGPALLLLDEPLGALDRKLREETQFQLKDIQRRLKTSFVIVTHDQDEALVLADRIAVMHAGKIEQIGAPSVIYDSPKTRFVAGFIGQTNMIEGHVERGDGDWFVAPFGRIALASCDVAHGAKATLSVRPERVIVSRAARTPGGYMGIVEDVAFRGETTHLRVRVASFGTLRISCANNDGFSANEPVFLDIPQGAGVLFAEAQ